MQAEDPDTKKEITYTIRQGPAELFTIDPVTGDIRTTRGLDYEEDTSYELIVGTVENKGNSPGATARIFVTVEVNNKENIKRYKYIVFCNLFGLL